MEKNEKTIAQPRRGEISSQVVLGKKSSHQASSLVDQTEALNRELEALRQEKAVWENEKGHYQKMLSLSEVATETVHESYLKRLTQQTESTKALADTVSHILGAMREIGQSYRDMLSAIQTVGHISHHLSDSFQMQTSAQEDIISQVEAVNTAALEEVKKAQALKSDLGQIHEIREFMSHSVDSSDEISSRLSLLSMNGRIEAAHAGKIGAGFSVVAQEMLRLQQESQTSIGAQKNKLKEFLPLMNSMQEKSDAVENQAKVQKDAIDRIAAGSQLIKGHIRGNLDKIDDLTHSVDELVASIEEGERTVQATDKQTSQVEKVFFEEIFVVKKMNDLDRFIFELSKKAKSLAEASHSIINEYQKISVLQGASYVWQGEAWMVTNKDRLPAELLRSAEASSWGNRVLVCVGQTANNPAVPRALMPERGILAVQPLNALTTPGHRLKILNPILAQLRLVYSDLENPSHVKNPLDHAAMACMESFDGELRQTYQTEISRGNLVCSFGFGGMFRNGDVLINQYLSTYQRTQKDAEKFNLLGESLMLSLQSHAELGHYWWEKG